MEAGVLAFQRPTTETALPNGNGTLRPLRSLSGPEAIPLANWLARSRQVAEHPQRHLDRGQPHRAPANVAEASLDVDDCPAPAQGREVYEADWLLR